jgi:hypothetical protein
MKQAFAIAGLLLAGCNASPERNATDNDVDMPLNEAAPAGPYEHTDNAALPDDKTSLDEPQGQIDPKSAEAAGQVVQSFGALIEQKRWGEAEALWGDKATADKFTADLKRNRESHLEIGKPGDPEGAAGSIYVTMPVVLYGKNASGADFRRGAEVILRRVNDVDGSTEAQRRWHIERIELKA